MRFDVMRCVLQQNVGSGCGTILMSFLSRLGQPLHVDGFHANMNKSYMDRVVLGSDEEDHIENGALFAALCQFGTSRTNHHLAKPYMCLLDMSKQTLRWM
eukprot:2151162-Amphidinium_carterae.1